MGMKLYEPRTKELAQLCIIDAIESCQPMTISEILECPELLSDFHGSRTLGYSTVLRICNALAADGVLLKSYPRGADPYQPVYFSIAKSPSQPEPAVGGRSTACPKPGKDGRRSPGARPNLPYKAVSLSATVRP